MFLLSKIFTHLQIYFNETFLLIVVYYAIYNKFFIQVNNVRKTQVLDIILKMVQNVTLY